MRKRFISMLVLLAAVVTGAVAQTTYKVSVKEGTEDATSWTIAPAEATTTGVAAGTPVTATYNGTKKVKSVKAKKAAPAYAANEYNEASWDGTKVVFTKETAASVTAVTNSDAAVIWGDGWYTVSGNVTITGNVMLTADAHLILQDGATLTINGQLDCNTNGKDLYIYGQKNGDGKLNVNSSNRAIRSNEDYRIEIHGGEITAAATGDLGLLTGYLAVYGGKLTATSGGGNGINFQDAFDVYGGEVEATSNATSSYEYCFGIRSGSGMDSDILTVYGGKVTATGNGIAEFGEYGSGFGCYVMSGTSGIKFYFSDNGTDWGEGASYDTATDARNIQKRYAKAE